MLDPLTAEVSTMQYSIDVGNPNAPDVAALLAASEAHSHSLYPPEGVHMLDVRNLMAPSVCFLVARSPEGVAEGCGAIVITGDSVAEIKRMYVAPAARGKGVGSLILQNLEAKAREAGVCVLRLETGPLQREAIRLYQRFGYHERFPFGDYEASPWSLFMEKEPNGDQNATPNILS